MFVHVFVVIASALCLRCEKPLWKRKNSQKFMVGEGTVTVDLLPF